MRVLVTGAAGFIGSNVVKALLGRFECVSVVGVDNMDAYYDLSLKEERLAELLEHESFTFYRGDISDKVFLNDVFDGFRPDYVLNFAAKVGVRHSVQHPEDYITTNINGFFNVLEACREHKVKHLVYASSSSVYGANADVPYSTEDRTDSPMSLYAATKKSNELMAYAYGNLYGLPSTGLRFFTVYGPAGRPDMAYFGFTEKMTRGERIQVFNNGCCRRDFTYVDDIVEGVVRVMMAPPAAEPVPCAVYNIGNSQPVDVPEFLRVLQEELIEAGVLPRGFKADVEMLPMQPGDVPETCADVSALEEKFGFRPSTSLREGLRAFARWYACRRCGKLIEN